ncbi:MAG: class E sortase [Solirubrobacteraceae bacterium]
MRRALGILLVVAGVLLVADAVLTVTWQEPLSALREHSAQQGLRRELRAAELGRAPVEVAAGRRGALAAVRARAARAARARRDGTALGELRIARIGLDVVTLTSASPEDLRRGPGLIARTSVPGRGRTTGIAGHRTTYGAPFRHIDRLRRGDAIVLATPYATFRYAVSGTRIVAPSDVAVLANRGGDRLVLSACHPLYSAAQRIVVSARLTAVERSANGLKSAPATAR